MTRPPSALTAADLAALARVASAAARRHYRRAYTRATVFDDVDAVKRHMDDFLAAIAELDRRATSPLAVEHRLAVILEGEHLTAHRLTVALRDGSPKARRDRLARRLRRARDARRVLVAGIIERLEAGE